MRWLAVVAVLAGCGRISFDPIAGDGGIDTSGDGADAFEQVIPFGAGIWLKMNTGPSAALGGVIDSAGGHIGSCAGGCPTRVAALHDSGYQFATEEVRVAYGADLAAGAGFTAGLWIRFTALPSTQGCVWSQPFGPAGSGFDTFTLCIDPDLTVLFDSESPGGTANTLVAPPLTLGSWHHLAFTWDGGVKRGYVDGAQVAQASVQIGTGTQPFSLGGESGSFFVACQVDDAVFYARSLSAMEIQQLAKP